MTQPLCAAALVLSMSLAVAPALAQRGSPLPIGGEAPTTGVRLTTPSLVEGTASALEISPGALGLVDAWSLQLHHAEMRDNGRVAGTGDGLFLASRLPLLRAVTFGAGLQWLRPPTAIGYSDSVKLSFGLGLQAGSRLALGLVYHTFFADNDPALDAIDTVDVGLALHATQWLSAGVAVRDLTTPLYGGLPLQRSYDVELALRPLISERLELGAAVRIGERRGDVDPRFRLVVEPLRGLRLLGELEIMRRDFYRTGNDRTDLRATLGLAFDFERVGLAVSSTLGRSLAAPAGVTAPADSVGAAFQGMGVTVSLRGARRVPLFEIERQVIELALGGKFDQHRMVGLVKALRLAEQRKSVAGVLFRIDGLQLGWGQVQELRRWIARLRKAGKTTVAYVHAPDTRSYYLASAAEHVLLDPDGAVALVGVSAQFLYLRGMLDLLGVQPNFVKIAEYKSAPEQLTNKQASKAAAEVREAILDDIYTQLTHDLARDRKRTAADIRQLIDGGPYTPPRALAAGLVDELVAPEELKKKVQRLAHARIASPAVLARRSDRWAVGPLLAVIIVEGDIVRGKSQTLPLFGRRLVGDETLVQTIQWAASNDRVKAVVLRVNSPGGSASASARIWRAVRKAASAKPLIVSFADVAASGGYYVAAGAHRIFAPRAAITGSIGIFTGKLDFSGLMAKLGITSESSSRGKGALLQAFDRSYSEEERSLILSRLQHFYRSFLNAVASGRKMKSAKVDAVARGRVWTGNQARPRHLIDAHGGLFEAMQEAKRRAGLPLHRPVPVVVLPKLRRTLLTRVLGAVIGNARAGATIPLPPAAKRALEVLPPVLMRARAGEPLARMPYRIELAP